MTRIDLGQIRIGVINLPLQERRRARVTAVLAELGLPFTRIEGIRDTPRHLGCSQSHLKAIEALRGHGPFLVLEDDVVATGFFERVIEVPEADLLYLGHSPFGHSRGTAELGTPEVTEAASPGFLRVHSMLAAHAILYLTETGTEAVAASIRQTIAGRFKRRHDIGLCALQRRHVVLATEKPFFTQSGEVQRLGKQDQRDGESTFVARARREGDVVTVGDTALTVVRHPKRGLELQAPAETAVTAG